MELKKLRVLNNPDGIAKNTSIERSLFLITEINPPMEVVILTTKIRMVIIVSSGF